ncbi:hypothetical protein [Clavibacter californiensis]|uniref:hypothetical protein n=1 Tax=Clavibacter californiensis TaxID=1401995 RepID=UPI0015F86046|nr:hypothetical protein [Clavibacter californiensis]UKF79949.1 hypothetical protein FGD68_14355 [Clavibacter californiensis]
MDAVTVLLCAVEVAGDHPGFVAVAVADTDADATVLRSAAVRTYVVEAERNG